MRDVEGLAAVVEHYMSQLLWERMKFRSRSQRKRCRAGGKNGLNG